MKAMWEPGWAGFFKNKDPQVIADEIYSIGDEPTKEQIVDKARNEDSELHDLFEWRDDVAAEQWREEQAKVILRKLKVVIVHDEKEEKPFIEVPVRMFFGDPQKPSGFVSVMKVMNNDDTYQALLNRAREDALSFRKKYIILKELEPLFDAIDKIL